MDFPSVSGWPTERATKIVCLKVGDKN